MSTWIKAAHKFVSSSLLVRRKYGNHTCTHDVGKLKTGSWVVELVEQAPHVRRLTSLITVGPGLRPGVLPLTAPHPYFNAFFPVIFIKDEKPSEQKQIKKSLKKKKKLISLIPVYVVSFMRYQGHLSQVLKTANIRMMWLNSLTMTTPPPIRALFPWPHDFTFLWHPLNLNLKRNQQLTEENPTAFSFNLLNHSCLNVYQLEMLWPLI